jgi:catechol-2,3-dioxygenase
LAGLKKWWSGEAMIPFEVQRIDHVVLRVRDIDRSVAFYKSLLGCEVVKRRDND